MIECREIMNEMSAKAIGAGKIKAATRKIDGRPEIARKITDGILKTAMNGSGAATMSMIEPVVRG